MQDVKIKSLKNDITVKKKKAYNIEMSLLKALGIFAIVAGHLQWGIFAHFYAHYAFHVILFFFIAGYFLNFEPSSDKVNILNKCFQFFTKKVKTLIVPFFIYNAFYACVTVIIFHLFNRLYGQLPTLYNFFVTSFTYGDQYDISGALWFIPAFFISLVIFYPLMFVLKKICDNKFFHLGFFLILATIGTYISFSRFQGQPITSAITLVCVRTLFCMFFIYLGYFYKIYLEEKIKFNINWLLSCILLQAILCMTFKNNAYFLSEGIFYDPISPILFSVNGIYLCLFIVKMISPLVKENSLIDKIGRNTYSIMANHLFVAFLISIVLFKIKHISYDMLPMKSLFTENFLYKPERYKYIYTIIAILIPTYLGESFRYLKYKLKISRDMKKEQVK